jgi:hypothetical protein
MAKNRHPNMRVCTLNIDYETWGLIESMAPNHKAIGQFVTTLVHCEYARRQERRMPREAVNAALENDHVPAPA